MTRTRSTLAAVSMAASILLSGCINIYTGGPADNGGGGNPANTPDPVPVVTPNPDATEKPEDLTPDPTPTPTPEAVQEVTSVKWIVSPTMPIDVLADPVLSDSTSNLGVWPVYEGSALTWNERRPDYTENAVFYSQNGKTGVMNYDGSILFPAVFTTGGNLTEGIHISLSIVGPFMANNNEATYSDECFSFDETFTTISTYKPVPTGLDQGDRIVSYNGQLYGVKAWHYNVTNASRGKKSIVEVVNDSMEYIGAQVLNGDDSLGVKWDYVLKDRFAANGYITVMKTPDSTDSIGLVDISNGSLITSSWYQAVKWFEDGVCPVKKNGKWGYINTDGKEVTDFIFDDASVSYNGRVFVKLNGKYGILDLKNTLAEKIEVTEKTCSVFEDNSQLRDVNAVIGTAKVKVEGLRIRKLPSASAEKAGNTENGKTYNVYDIYTGPSYKWYRIGDGQWIADTGSWVDYKAN